MMVRLLDYAWRKAVFLVCLIVALSCTACVAAYGDGSTRGPIEDVPTVEYVLEQGYPVNENGLTYGPSVPGSPEMPDLVSAEGNNGVIGYVYLREMMGSEPSSIEEAMSGEYSGPREVPLYCSDGVTIIGTFSIG